VTNASAVQEGMRGLLGLGCLWAVVACGSTEAGIQTEDGELPTEDSGELVTASDERGAAAEPGAVNEESSEAVAADVEPSADAEPDFMVACLATVPEVNDTTIAQCHGLEVSWRISQEHTWFMDRCMPATQDVATCQALYTHWIARPR
jgi:hypothetical protein